ncbi:hypothetical protein L2243_25810, partial [Xanthomonas perforans]|nr:hypothetical protein [Xanthomonas perforans]
MRQLTPQPTARGAGHAMATHPTKASNKKGINKKAASFDAAFSAFPSRHCVRQRANEGPLL